MSTAETTTAQRDETDEDTPPTTDAKATESGPEDRGGFFGYAQRLADNAVFQGIVIGVILINAIILGLETYPPIADSVGPTLRLIDHVIVGFFVLELLVRFAAVGFHPVAFFKRGWNIFDFLIVGAAFLPGLADNSTLLRLVRLARVARLLAVLPDVRVILDGIRRSVQPVSGLAFVTIFLLYIYGMVGHTLFGEANPDRWGTIGTAMLTLFTVLTLEGWPDVFAEVQDVSGWSTLYFITFILGAVFVVMNMVIGIVLSTLEEAREAAREKQRDAEKAEHQLEVAREIQILEGVDELRRTVAELKAKLDDSGSRRAATSAPEQSP